MMPEAKELARHSDIKTTMRYTHIGINDQARALASLVAPTNGSVPANAPRGHSEKKAALQMRCNFRGAEGHSLTLNGTEHDDQKRQNPRNCKGFDAVWQWMSEVVKIGATGLTPDEGDAETT